MAHILTVRLPLDNLEALFERQNDSQIRGGTDSIVCYLNEASLEMAEEIRHLLPRQARFRIISIGILHRAGCPEYRRPP